jgi:hypothetical protein
MKARLSVVKRAVSPFWWCGQIHNIAFYFLLTIHWRTSNDGHRAWNICCSCHVGLVAKAARDYGALRQRRMRVFCYAARLAHLKGNCYCWFGRCSTEFSAEIIRTWYTKMSEPLVRVQRAHWYLENTTVCALLGFNEKSIRTPPPLNTEHVTAKVVHPIDPAQRTDQSRGS